MNQPPATLSAQQDVLIDYVSITQKNVETLSDIIAGSKMIASDWERVGAALRSMGCLAERD